MPQVSVIIPTHNRSQVLKRTLDALGQQTFPHQEMEVVVVADGCKDNTVEFLHSYTAPFSLQVIEQSGQGPAVARNQGALRATAPLLIFMDDDILASPQFVAAHVNAHQRENCVAIGYLPTILDTQTGFFRSTLRGWWEAMFQKMRQTDHRFAYTDLLSGNFSVSAGLFAAVGGFDPAFRCHEDYELGVRLLKANAEFVFASEAWGYHYEMTDLNRSLQRKFQEGKADMQLGEKFPELKPVLLLARLMERCSLLDRILLFLIFRMPVVGDFLAAGLRQGLDVLEWMRIRSYWRSWLDRLLGYWYLRGVSEATSIQYTWSNFSKTALDASSSPPETELDLKQGFEAAEQHLDRQRPTSVRLRYGQHIVGDILAQPGAERLRGVHLRSALAGNLAGPYLAAVTLDKSLYSTISPSLESANSKLQPLEVSHAN